MSLYLRAAPPPGWSPVPSPTPSPLAVSPMAKGDDNGECNLLGSFSVLIQGALGALALLSLVYKRWRERPQRPVKIWAFDVSKQVIGSILLHLLNLAMSEVSSGTISLVAAAAKGAQSAVESAPDSGGGDEVAAGLGEQINGMGMLALRSVVAIAARAKDGKMPAGAQNPCSFYLLNLAIDTTLGIPILITLLKLVTFAAKQTALARPPESIESGKYGQPPKTTWWLKQCLIYFIGLLGMKFCVFMIFQLCPWLGAVGDWALAWTNGSQQLQIVFVMFLFPLIMNAMQYYIIDTFIKEQKPKEAYEQVSQEDDAVGEADGAAEAGRPSVDGEEATKDDLLNGGNAEARGRPSEDDALLGSDPAGRGRKAGPAR